jgi:toxin HigB-1
VVRYLRSGLWRSRRGARNAQSGLTYAKCVVDYQCITVGVLSVQFRHADKTLKRIDEEADFDGGFASAVVKALRRRMQQIRAAVNENDLRQFNSLRFERLKGKRKHEYSIRLNDQMRLIFQIEKTDDGNIIVVTGIEDYH